MSAQVEKLSAALAAAKEAIRTLKAEKSALKVEFKEELKAVKTGKKPTVKKAAKKVTKPAVKKTTSKIAKKEVVSKAPAVKKPKTPKIKNVAPVTNIAVEEKTEDNVISHQEVFSDNE